MLKGYKEEILVEMHCYMRKVRSNKIKKEKEEYERDK
jgi:hypothetical protein